LHFLSVKNSFRLSIYSSQHVQNTKKTKMQQTTPFAAVPQGNSLPEGYVSPFSAPQQESQKQKRNRGRPKKHIIIALENQQEAVTVQRMILPIQSITLQAKELFLMSSTKN